MIDQIKTHKQIVDETCASIGGHCFHEATDPDLVWCCKCYVYAKKYSGDIVYNSSGPGGEDEKD